MQGAGDTAIAALTLARLAGGSLLEAAVIANAAAGVVVGKVGTATATRARSRRSCPARCGAALGRAEARRVIASMTGFGRAELEVDGAGFPVEVRTREPPPPRPRGCACRARSPGSSPSCARAARRRFARGKVELVGGGAARRGARGARSSTRARRPLRRGRARARGRARLARRAARARAARRCPAWRACSSPSSPRRRCGAALGAARRARRRGRRRDARAEGAALERELRGAPRRGGGARGRGRGALGRGGGRGARAAAEARRAARAPRPGLPTRRASRRSSCWAADRLDVTEELVRLRSHVAQFGPRSRRRRGHGRGPAPRVPAPGDGARGQHDRLEGADAPLAHLVVDLKTELERIREQVLNVE